MPFTLVVGLNDVETRGTLGNTHHQINADAFGFPAGDHFVAPGVVSERRDEIDGDAQTSHIQRGIERIAAIAAREPAIRLLAEFDHAFADASYGGDHLPPLM